MNWRRFKAIVFPLVLIIFFIVIPWAFFSVIPPQFLEFTGLKLESTLTALTFFGLALATLSFLKRFFLPDNIIQFGASLLSEITWFFVFLYFIGFGNPFNFGLVQQTIPMGSVTPTLTMDFRFFVVLMAIVVALKISKESLIFCSIKEKRE